MNIKKHDMVKKVVFKKKRINCHLAIVNPPHTLSQALERHKQRGRSHTHLHNILVPSTIK